jgi:hypothetical protein
MRLNGDFESASIGSLPRIGAYKYASDPSTRILCFAYAIDDDEPVVWFPTLQAPPPYLIAAALDPKLEFHLERCLQVQHLERLRPKYGLPPAA